MCVDWSILPGWDRTIASRMAAGYLPLSKPMIIALKDTQIVWSGIPKSVSFRKVIQYFKILLEELTMN